MNREIKFRVWDNAEKNGMVYFGSSFYLDDDNDTLTFFSEKGCVLGDNDKDGDRFILMQYTGLKDKNGVEIYEGDLVREYGSDIDYGVDIVEYSINRFICRNLDTGGVSELDCGDNYRVVGNIYENQEPLTNKL